jgi:hypothetical protein
VHLSPGRVVAPALLATAIALSLAACGSSAAPRPTPTATRTAHPPARNLASRHVAHRFLKAFMEGKRHVMISLMTPALLSRNRHQFVSQMLGVDGPPGSFSIRRVHAFHTTRGKWIRVVARLQLDHGTSLDWLGVVKTHAGWRINSIRQAHTSA